MTEEPRTGLQKITGPAWSFAKGIVPLAASGVALTFVLDPGLIPDPRTVLAATVAVQTVEPHVTFGEYLARYHPETIRTADRESLTNPGDIVYLRVQIQGQKHGSLTLETLRFSWATKRLVSAREMLAKDDEFVPATPNDQWVAPVWVADPLDGHAFMVRLMIHQGPTILAFADTNRISPQ